ncbi:hypothetical protein A9G09_01045 [Gilliamella sp. wkB292]|uniref:DUF7710 domain-containing protein n=1 Tax=unclassified Gilliamella TaxID=2685620 RepID=UPI00080E893C|nr:hypothetical protein [Gilliamella apicola]OCG17922.1 hypothetical protein A9G09_01045 [Gilliamella apicola]OCL15683.1 hypothetical protein A9G03_00705 [Gilliamella apicola]
MTSFIWVFHGHEADFCSGVYSELEQAENFIKKNLLSGVLTKMPLNKSVYEWTTENGFFEPKTDYQHSSKFIQKFTSAYLEHHHYQDGERIPY